LQTRSCQSNFVHNGITFWPFNARGDITGVVCPPLLGSTARSSFVRILAAGFDAVDKRKPIAGGVVVFHRACLNHVSQTLGLTMLTGEDPIPSWTLRLLCIAIRIEAEVHDGAHSLYCWVHLLGAVVFATRSHRFTVKVDFHILSTCCSNQKKKIHLATQGLK